MKNAHQILSFFSTTLFLIILPICLFCQCQPENASSPDAVQQSLNTISYRSLVLQNSPQKITIPLPDLPPDAKKLEMILIPKGSFTMGSPIDETGRVSENEWPAHKVTLTKPFYMGIYEITQAQWEAVLGQNSHRSKFKGHPNHPVEKVSWRECQRFIKKLNQLGQGNFRLPTEAEWEYACHAGSTSPFSFGDSFTFADKFVWYQRNNNQTSTLAVGQKQPNSWGLYDMHGNVSEWCADQWEAPHPRTAQIDPKGPQFSLLFIFTNRVFKGGSYRDGIEKARAAWRYYEQEFDYHYSLGFRVVRDYE